MFITLTNYIDDSKVRFNVSQISSYGQDGINTEATRIGGWLIKESPDQIDKIIKRAGVTVV